MDMKTSQWSRRFLLFLALSVLFLLASCAPAATTGVTQTVSASATPAATATVSASAAPAATTAESFDDPFTYCAAVDTIDQPDARYTGEKTPEDLVEKLMQATGASADAPVDVFSQGTFWRCMDKKVYACFVGANLPCESKANTSQEPTAEMNDYCAANPATDSVPAAVTGHDTIYSWACENGKAVTDQQVFHVDERGYIQEIWHELAP